jgi:hypothetical protein
MSLPPALEVRAKKASSELDFYSDTSPSGSGDIYAGKQGNYGNA